MVELDLGTPTPDSPKPAILILDQDDATRAAVIDTIRNIAPDSRIFETNTIKDAIQKTKNQKFDLVISDTRADPIAGNTAVSFITKIPPEYAPNAVYVVSSTVDEFELMSDLPTATLHAFPLEKPVFEKNFRELFKIPAPKAATKKGFDIEFINPFLMETIRVVKAFAHTDSKRENLIVKTPAQPSGDISGMMAINCEAYKGSFAVAFDEKCFCAMASTLTNSTVTAISPANQDIAGEICNQILGSAKKTLNSMGHSILQTLPVIAVGKGHAVKHPVPGPCVTVKFITAAGNFQIEAILMPAG